MKNNVALIPARSGSKRVVNKNITPLNGHPLIAYSIISAIEVAYDQENTIEEFTVELQMQYWESNTTS